MYIFHYCFRMGSLGFKFTPLNPSLPVQVFVSIIEHESTTRGLDESSTISFALDHLDSSNVQRSDLVGSDSWPRLKALLISQFGGKQCRTEEKLEQISSLTKSPAENCHHFLLKVKHLVSQVAGPDEWTQLLFLLGLSYEERSMFDLNNLPSLHQICNTINAYLLDTAIKTEEDPAEGLSMGAHRPSPPPKGAWGWEDLKGRRESTREEIPTSQTRFYRPRPTGRLRLLNSLRNIYAMTTNTFK